MSGRCMAVYNVRTDEPVVTVPCDTKDSLQWWECSTENPFRLLLRDTSYSPSTYVQVCRIFIWSIDPSTLSIHSIYHDSISILPLLMSYHV